MNPHAVALCAVALIGALAAGRAGDAAELRPSVQTLVSAVIAGDRDRVSAISEQLRSQPRPRGDRRRARDLNERGLALWQRQRYDEAAAFFSQARAADGGDAEIAENLGYALLKAGRVNEAEGPILDALALAPDRASAWGTLGTIYAKQGKHRAGVACILTAYGYTRDRKRTLGVYNRLAVSDDDPKVRAMLADALSRLPRT